MIRSHRQISSIENLQSLSVEPKLHVLGRHAKDAVRISGQVLLVRLSCIFFQKVAHWVSSQAAVRQTIRLRAISHCAQDRLQLLQRPKMSRLRVHSGLQVECRFLQVTFLGPQFTQPYRCRCTQTRLTVSNLIRCLCLASVSKAFFGNSQVIGNLGIRRVALLRRLKEAFRLFIPL